MKYSFDRMKLQTCKLKKGRAEGSGYTEGREYQWAGTCGGWVEITDPVTTRVSYERNEVFDRNFTDTTRN
jgi:hypothetical protein